jgi:hypothetical protein
VLSKSSWKKIAEESIELDELLDFGDELELDITAELTDELDDTFEELELTTTTTELLDLLELEVTATELLLVEATDDTELVAAAQVAMYAAIS